jgi:C4-dicarboxylate-specific signal transduction histidine kinase
MKLLDTFKFVKKVSTELDDLNKSINKITLTGKINALEAAATLFDFTDATAVKFNHLKEKLVDVLIEHTLAKNVNELRSKSSIVMDVLIRNLFERTADVGFLSTDGMIIKFLTDSDVSREEMRDRLHEYKIKYSVYSEIVIFDTNGECKVNLDESNQIKSTKDSIIQEALQSDSYVEVYKNSDIYHENTKTLMYAQKIMDKNNPIGVLCLCFSLDDELERIFQNLKQDDEILVLASGNSVVASTYSTLRINKYISYSDEEYTFADKNIQVSTKTVGYQGYNGLKEWYALATKIKDTQNQTSKYAHLEKPKKLNLLNEELKNIIDEADELIDDLGDVIINGELIASRKKVYVLSPILESLREVSENLVQTIKASVDNLSDIVEESLINDALVASNLAIDIMDRNLYERANDCRWWAITPEFQEQLASKEPDLKKINGILKYINDLYTVYTNLFIYDTNGVIVAASNETQVIGQKIDYIPLNSVMGNRNTQNYYVSKFEKTQFYKNEATYIYNATINNSKNSVGGIGIVFDAKVEFEAILQDCFPKGKKGFALFIDNERRIISTTNKELVITKEFDIDEEFLKESKKRPYVNYVKYNDKNYIASCSLSKGYREYKTKDNYKNTVYALMFIEV